MDRASALQHSQITRRLQGVRRKGLHPVRRPLDQASTLHSLPRVYRGLKSLCYLHIGHYQPIMEATLIITSAESGMSVAYGRQVAQRFTIECMARLRRRLTSSGGSRSSKLVAARAPSTLPYQLQASSKYRWGLMTKLLHLPDRIFH